MVQRALRGGGEDTWEGRQETLDGEDHHREGNRRVKRMDGRDPIARDQEGETRRGWSCGVVLPKWNVLAQSRRENSQDQLGTI